MLFEKSESDAISATGRTERIQPGKSACSSSALPFPPKFKRCSQGVSAIVQVKDA